MDIEKIEVGIMDIVQRHINLSSTKDKVRLEIRWCIGREILDYLKEQGFTKVEKL